MFKKETKYNANFTFSKLGFSFSQFYENQTQFKKKSRQASKSEDLEINVTGEYGFYL